MIVGLRRDPKHKKMDDTKSRNPMCVVTGARCDLKYKIIDDAKHMNPMLVVIGSSSGRNQNPLDVMPICFDYFAILFCCV